jgi:hypothetical protein
MARFQPEAATLRPEQQSVRIIKILGSFFKEFGPQ